jgi:hypothetical protein
MEKVADSGQSHLDFRTDCKPVPSDRTGSLHVRRLEANQGQIYTKLGPGLKLRLIERVRSGRFGETTPPGVFGCDHELLVR